jgi:hypothetical protein
MPSLRLVLCLVLLPGLVLAQAPAPLLPQMSPIVTWDPDRETSRPPTERALTAAEMKVARGRADRVYDVVKATPGFSTPTRYVTLVTAWPIVWDRVVREHFYVYWSAPKDTLKRADGSLWPKMGGAHNLVYVRTNTPPAASHLEDRATRGNFSRGFEESGRSSGVFAEPRTFGQVGGGILYNEMLAITRDGRPVLEPAPIGPLLEQEIARVRKIITDLDRGTKSSLDQLEASMTPAAKAERRARRADRWKTQFRNPTTLEGELAAADKSDESDYQTQKARLSPPATRDPKSVYWAPRLALEAIEQRLASLDDAGRKGGACGRVDPAFSADYGVRFEPVGSAGASCVPMVRIREDLVDPRRPGEVQLLTIWMSESPCGEQWAGKPSLQSNRCDVAVPLLREIDWPAMRAAMGW